MGCTWAQHGLQGRLAERLDQRTLQGPRGIEWPRGLEEHPVQQATRQGVAARGHRQGGSPGSVTFSVHEECLKRWGFDALTWS